MLKRLFVCFVLVLLGVRGHAQNNRFLIFEKSPNRRAFYYPGDVISLRVTGSKVKLTGRIIELQDSLVLFDYHRVNVKDVTHIYVDDKQKLWYGFRYKLEKLLLIAGAGYLVADVVNT